VSAVKLYRTPGVLGSRDIQKNQREIQKKKNPTGGETMSRIKHSILGSESLRETYGRSPEVRRGRRGQKEIIVSRGTRKPYSYSLRRGPRRARKNPNKSRGSQVRGQAKRKRQQIPSRTGGDVYWVGKGHRQGAGIGCQKPTKGDRAGGVEKKNIARFVEHGRRSLLERKGAVQR